MFKRPKRGFSAEELSEFIGYDPLEGRFIWKVFMKGGRGIYPGSPAGSRSHGYLQIMVFGRYYRGTHLAYLLMTGGWPPSNKEMDHRDGDQTNDRWINIRPATHSQNMLNQASAGVFLRKDGWEAYSCKDKQYRSLGYYPTFEEAREVRREFELREYGDFAHGR